MLLLIPGSRKIIFGEDPYILIDDKKIIYKTELSRKKQSIDIQNIKEIKFDNNCYTFIDENDKVVKIPIGKSAITKCNTLKVKLVR